MEHDSNPSTAGAEPRQLSALERRAQQQLIRRVAQEMALRVEPDWNSAPLAGKEKQLSELDASVHRVRVQKLDERWKIFLERLSANGGIVSLTLRQCGFNSTSLRQRRLRHAGFEEQFLAAMESGIDKLEDVARHRALYGVQRPIFYRGRKVSEVTELSDDLLKFMLRAHRPEKYGNKLELSGQLDFTGIDFTRLTEAELQAIAANEATEELLDRIRNTQSLPSSQPGPQASPAASALALSGAEDAVLLPAATTEPEEPDGLGGEPRSR